MLEPDVTIDTALVSRLVATQFPRWKDLAVRPVASGGWDDRTFHLGDHMLVRLPSAAAYALQVEKEHRWLPRLAPLLPLPVPVPLAMGAPVDDYPWHWSVYRWIEGETATLERIASLPQFAAGLAQFLVALQRIDPAGGPAPGQHNFFRGGPLSVYDGEDPASNCNPRRQDRQGRRERGVGSSACRDMARRARLVPRRRQLGKPVGQARCFERRDRLRNFRRGRSLVRLGDCVDALRREKPRGVSRRSSGR